jgi:hypothetical protein
LFLLFEAQAATDLWLVGLAFFCRSWLASEEAGKSTIDVV